MKKRKNTVLKYIVLMAVGMSWSLAVRCGDTSEGLEVGKEFLDDCVGEIDHAYSFAMHIVLQHESEKFDQQASMHSSSKLQKFSSMVDDVDDAKPSKKAGESITSNKGPFNCTKCAKTYRGKRDLIEHMKHPHEQHQQVLGDGWIRYQCLGCKKKYDKIANLNKHMLSCKPETSSFSSHSSSSSMEDGLQHVCPACNKEYPKPCVLNQHILTCKAARSSLTVRRSSRPHAGKKRLRDSDNNAGEQAAKKPRTKKS